MATIQSDGLTSVTATSTYNNRGTIKTNGLVSGTFVSSATTLEKSGVFGSVVVDNNSADKAIGGGVFSYNNQRPVAKKLTPTLSTVSNDFLVSGALVPSNIRSIHKLETLRTRRQTSAIRQGYFNDFTGKYDEGYPVVAVDALATDEAANPSRENPGELVYIAGNSNTILVPVTDDYKPKTN